jgi:hypothetical protein
MYSPTGSVREAIVKARDAGRCESAIETCLDLVVMFTVKTFLVAYLKQ